jgi:hypothetical protein
MLGTVGVRLRRWPKGPAALSGCNISCLPHWPNLRVWPARTLKHSNQALQIRGFPLFLLSLAGCSVCGLGGRMQQSPSRPRFSPTHASSSSRPRRHGWRSDLGPRRHGRSSDLGRRRHIRSFDLGPRRHGRARNASPWPDSSPRRRRPLLAPSRRPRCTSLAGTCTERAGCQRAGPLDAKPVSSTHPPSTAFARGRRRLRRCFHSVAAAAADGRRAIAASPWLEGALARPEAGGR